MHTEHSLPLTIMRHPFILSEAQEDTGDDDTNSEDGSDMDDGGGLQDEEEGGELGTSKHIMEMSLTLKCNVSYRMVGG